MRLFCLADNLAGDHLGEAGGHLGGKITGHFLGILEFLDRAHVTPPQGERVEPAVEVRRVAVEQRSGAIPLCKHGGLPRLARHPDVRDREMEIGQDAAEALERAA